MLTSAPVSAERESIGPAGRPPRIRTNRVADLVANHLRDRILSGELSDGGRLPSIESLVREFGVSIAAIREALRILESEGLVSVHRGKLGGAVVHIPSEDTAAYTVAMVLRSRNTPIGDCLRAQRYLEPICAALGAGRKDRRRMLVPGLRKANAGARAHFDDEDDTAFREDMLKFHIMLIEHCGNDTLGLFVGILDSMFLASQHHVLPASDDFRTASSRLRSLESHEMVCDLIDSGDDAEVSKEMQAHIDDMITMRSGHLHDPVDPTAIRLAW